LEKLTLALSPPLVCMPWYGDIWNVNKEKGYWFVSHPITFFKSHSCTFFQAWVDFTTPFLNKIYPSYRRVRIWKGCNLKIVSYVCMWMKATNLNLGWWLNYWRRVVSTTLKNLFLICYCIWCVLLFCRLWWREFGELTTKMECNFCSSMKTL
jgi:hypothetical protein